MKLVLVPVVLDGNLKLKTNLKLFSFFNARLFSCKYFFLQLVVLTSKWIWLLRKHIDFCVSNYLKGLKFEMCKILLKVFYSKN